MTDYLTDPQAAAALARGQADPVWWIETVLKSPLWSAQKRIVEAVRDHRRVAVRSCHGGGKSHVAARISLQFLHCHPQSIVVTTAPTHRQVRLILWQEIQRAWSRARPPLGPNPPNQVELTIAPGWYATGFSPADYSDDTFQGIHPESGFILVVVDEAAGVGSRVMGGVEGVLSSEYAHLLQIGNPTDPSSQFAGEFRQPGTAKIVISCFDTPNFTDFGVTLEDVRSGEWRAKVEGRKFRFPGLVTPSWVEERGRRWGWTNPAFVSRALAQFPEDSEGTLIPLAWIERAKLRSYEPAGSARRIGGLDVAAGGSSESVLGLRQGRRFRIIWSAKGQATMETPDRAIAAVRSGAVEHVFLDNIGVGAFLPLFLQRASAPVTGVNAGSDAFEPDRFLNLKAEAYWTMRVAFEKDEVDLDPDDEELAAQLASLRYELVGGGKIKIESKADARERGVESPDRAEAMMLTYCGPAPDTWTAGNIKVFGRGSVVEGYDSPFADYR